MGRDSGAGAIEAPRAQTMAGAAEAACHEAMQLQLLRRPLAGGEQRACASSDAACTCLDRNELLKELEALKEAGAAAPLGARPLAPGGWLAEASEKAAALAGALSLSSSRATASMSSSGTSSASASSRLGKSTAANSSTLMLPDASQSSMRQSAESSGLLSLSPRTLVTKKRNSEASIRPSLSVSNCWKAVVHSSGDMPFSASI